eukprot:scaffold48823_cov27-Tisochrysis_lutea.AAC.3
MRCLHVARNCGQSRRTTPRCERACSIASIARCSGRIYLVSIGFMTALVMLTALVCASRDPPLCSAHAQGTASIGAPLLKRAGESASGRGSEMNSTDLWRELLRAEGSGNGSTLSESDSSPAAAPRADRGCKGSSRVDGR